MDAPDEPSAVVVARRVGIALQALLLGTGLFFATLKLLQLGTDAQLFRYQGF